MRGHCHLRYALQDSCALTHMHVHALDSTLQSAYEDMGSADCFLWASRASVDCTHSFMSDLPPPAAEEYCSVVLRLRSTAQWSCNIFWMFELCVDILVLSHSFTLDTVASLGIVVSFYWQCCKGPEVGLWGQRASTFDVLIVLHYWEGGGLFCCCCFVFVIVVKYRGKAWGHVKCQWWEE